MHRGEKKRVYKNQDDLLVDQKRQEQNMTWHAYTTKDV